MVEPAALVGVAPQATAPGEALVVAQTARVVASQAASVAPGSEAHNQSSPMQMDTRSADCQRHRHRTIHLERAIRSCRCTHKVEGAPEAALGAVARVATMDVGTVEGWATVVVVVAPAETVAK